MDLSTFHDGPMATAAVKVLDTYFRQFPLVTAPAGSVFIRENELFTNIRYIATGYVRMYINAACGRELSIQLYGPDMFFPSIIGFSHRHSRVVLESMTPVTFRETTVSDFYGFLHSHPDVLFDLTRRTSAIVYSYLAKMELIMTAPAYQMVVAILLMFADVFDRGYASRSGVRIPMSHQSISTWINVTRETVSRNVELLERKGLLRCHNQNIVVLDRAALRRELNFVLP